MNEYIADGINYDRKWVEEFFDDLDDRNVWYIYNTILLRERAEAGENVFNPKYDANHWNDLGAYYGVNAILEELKQDIDSVHVNEWSELNVCKELKTSLLISEFPIEEYIPKMLVKDVEVSTELYE